MAISVHISEDSSALRSLLRRWLERDERLSVVGEAGNGEDALLGVAATQPDIALLDLSMPRSRGADMISEIRQRSPGTRVLVLTGTALGPASKVMQEADGFLLKPAPMPELASIVCDLMGGVQPMATGARRSSPA